jgi:hypothetical protein
MPEISEDDGIEDFECESCDFRFKRDLAGRLHIAIRRSSD